MIYIRKVEKELFEWLVVFGNQLHTNYLIISPKAGKKDFTKSEIAACAGLLFTGAVTTVDMLIEEATARAKKTKASPN
jgi:hypothetical protein